LPQVSTSIRAAFGVIFVFGALAPATHAGSQTVRLNQSERSLLSAVNEVRSSRGLSPLRVDPALAQVARSYSATLIRTDVFTHGDMAGRLVRSGARGPRFGENLAWGVGSYATARYIVRSWMASPGHRANLLRPGWNRIGLGALKGNFLGYDAATVVTAEFAGR
jgi:serralysin